MKTACCLLFKSTSFNYRGWMYLLVNVSLIMRPPPQRITAPKEKKNIKSFRSSFFQLQRAAETQHLCSWQECEWKADHSCDLENWLRWTFWTVKPVKNRTINETLSNSPPPSLQLLDKVSPAHLVQQMAQLTREQGEWERRRWWRGEGERKGGRIENRSAAWRSQHHRMSLLQLSGEPEPPSVSNFYVNSRKKKKAFTHHVSLLKCAQSTHTRAHLPEKMDCKRKLESTSAAHWISLRDRAAGNAVQTLTVSKLFLTRFMEFRVKSGEACLRVVRSAVVPAQS